MYKKVYFLFVREGITRGNTIILTYISRYFWHHPTSCVPLKVRIRRFFIINRSKIFNI